MGGTNEKIACPVCGKSLTKNGLPGHMRFKHGTDTKGQRRLDSDSGILNEEAIMCPKCGSKDMDAISLTGDIVKLEGTVNGNELLSDAKPYMATIRVMFKGGTSVPITARLKEKAPAGKKFLKLKCPKCGTEKTITLAVS